MSVHAVIPPNPQPGESSKKRLLACLPHASDADLRRIIDATQHDDPWHQLVLVLLEARATSSGTSTSHRLAIIRRIQAGAQNPGLAHAVRVTALAEAAFLAYNLREWELCEHLIESVQTESRPSDNHRLRILGIRLRLHVFLEQRRWRLVDQALAESDLILADCPDSDLVLEFRCHRLRYLMDRRHYQACRALFAELEPETQRIHRCIGWSYHEAYARFCLESGDLRTMAWLLSEACPIAITPQLAVPYYLALGQYNKAAAHLPPSEEAPYLAGLLALAQGNTEEVRRALGDLHATPDHLHRATPQLLHLAALAALAEGRPQHARLCLAQLDPDEDYGDCHVEWARMYLALHQREPARWHLRTAIEVSGLPSVLLRLRCAVEISAADVAGLWLAAIDDHEAIAARPSASSGDDPLLSGPPTLWSDDNPGEALLIGDSPEMQRVRRRLNLFADRDETVLILAETGCGKEIAARMVHDLGPRRERPFVAVNCAALSESLAEAELFGHAAGAFTGGEQAREGLLAAAGQGTLFLDEAIALPARLQGLLLRVLETGDYMPVGSTKPRQCRARIVAAANESLEQAAEDGRFRRDLYFRLCRLSVDIPPLRERLDDLDALTSHFIRNRGLEGRHQIDESLLTHWRSYDWPGNVRELRNEIDNLIILHGAEACWTADHVTTRVSSRRPDSRSPPLVTADTSSLIAYRTPVPGIGRALERRRQILKLVQQQGRLTQKQAIAALGCAVNTARADLAALCQAGLLRRIKTSANLATGWFEEP